MIDPNVLRHQRAVIAGDAEPAPLACIRKDKRRRGRPALCEQPGCRHRSHAIGLCWRHWYQKKSGMRLTPRLRGASPAFVEKLRAKLAAKGIVIREAA